MATSAGPAAVAAAAWGTEGVVSKGTGTVLRQWGFGGILAMTGVLWGRPVDDHDDTLPRRTSRFGKEGVTAAKKSGPPPKSRKTKKWIPKLPFKRRTEKDTKDQVSSFESPTTKLKQTMSSIRRVVTRVVIPSLAAVYTIYPMASLLLFRLPEALSWLGVFQNNHQCWATLNHKSWRACVKLYTVHILMLAPSLGAFWLWGFSKHRSSFSKAFKWKVMVLSCLVAIASFKLSVDHWWLYHPPRGIDLLQGKVAVVTGANRGIGLGTALALAERGAHVVVTCRTLAKCQPVVDQIERTTLKGSAQAVVLDLTRLESASRLAEQLSADYPEIHYFFANAGTTPRQELTHEGLEDGFGGMHLAHMAVVLGILPNLQRGGAAGGDTMHPSRVVVVSSEMSINAAMGIFGNDLMFSTTATAAGGATAASTQSSTEATKSNRTKILEDDLNDDWRGERTRGDGTIGPSLAAYGRAKLCGVLFALELNRRMARHGIPVISHAVHPGAVVTDSSRNSILHAFPQWIPGLRWVVGHVYFPVLWRTVQGGARSLLCPALSQAPHIVQGGQYLDALCQPFFHDRYPNPAREKETLIQIPSFLFGGDNNTSYGPKTFSTSIQLDPVQAVLLADVRWSERLWNVSVAFLQDSPARPVLDRVPW
uniref:Protochlorophyllide reductase n=1 Tax=Amphora coffeiformis TaxID=265554 RepID=A0A7S3L4P3_9STRA